MKRFLLLDSFNSCNRAKFAFPDMRFGSRYTGAAYGYMRDLAIMARSLRCTKVVPCWDGGNSFRRGVFPEYKAKRTAKRKAESTAFDQEAFQQFLAIRDELLPELGFRNVLECPGYECDDVMAKVVADWPAHWTERPIMATTDEDMYQCLRKCDIWNPSKNELMDAELFSSRHGMPPEMWALVKTVGGCSTDEVPGVRPGSVGEGTAEKWVRGEIAEKSAYRRHIDGEDGVAARTRNIQLVVLPAPGTTIPEAPVADEVTMERYVAVCTKLGFRSLLVDPYLSNWKWLVDCCAAGDSAA
jgi:5'-3' exonuclease